MNTEIRGFLAQRLREERKRLKLSQDEMAALGGVKPRTYQDWERGIASANAEFLATAELSGMDAAYVLTGRRAAPTNMSAEQMVLLASFASSDEFGRSALLAVASLASRPASKEEKGNTVKIAGDVGQSIAGDASFAAPVSFAVGKKKAD
ncbi:helix-turn-helix domain-containing protein [Comamonas resistens]